MNVLVAPPHTLTSLSRVEQYFRDIDRLGFDVACTTCRAYSPETVLGPLSEIYAAFSAMARSRGIAASIGINTYYCTAEFMDSTEFQYHRDNRPAELDEGYYASFASEKWREHLKALTRVFVEEFGFNWVQFGEPICGVDIPGSRDRVYAEYLRAFPESPYPQRREETKSYLSLQKLKTDVVIALCEDLCGYAKSVGAERVGLMPRPFNPALDPCVDGVSNPMCCDNGRLIFLPAVEFASVRVLPNSRLAEDGYVAEMALDSYAEVLSNSLGKGVFALIHAPNQQGDPPGLDLSCGALWKTTLATMAAAPCGIGLYWQPETGLLDTDYAQVLALAADVLPRMGGQRAPAGVVFSQSGMLHDDGTVEGAWPPYRDLMKYFHGTMKWPSVTFHASAIEEQLASSPQTRSILLEEHSPLTADQVASVLRWWRAEPGRSITVVGSGRGLSADPNEPGERSLGEAFPGLLENIGIKEVEPSTIHKAPESAVRLVAHSTRIAQVIGDVAEVVVDGIAHVAKIFGSGCRVLCSDEQGNPVITYRREGNASAYFLGLGCVESAFPILVRLLTYIMVTDKIYLPPLIPVSGDFLWNCTGDGYIIIANISGETVQARLLEHPYVYWDVVQQTMIRDESVDLELAPGDIRVLRCVTKTTKLIDVVHALYIGSIKSGSKRADVDLYTGRDPGFIVTKAPHKLLVDGEPESRFTLEACSSFTRVNVHGVPAGRHVITMLW
jgi:hypothetical protein